MRGHRTMAQILGRERSRARGATSFSMSSSSASVYTGALAHRHQIDVLVMRTDDRE